MEVNIIWLVFLGLGSAVGVFNGIFTLLKNAKQAKGDTPFAKLKAQVEELEREFLPNADEIVGRNRAAIAENTKNLERDNARISRIEEFDVQMLEIVRNLLANALRGNHKEQLTRNEDELIDLAIGLGKKGK